MRALHTIAAVVVLLASCTTTTYTAPSSSSVARWEHRDISELVTAIGPFDTTSIRGDSRSYDWFRFGNCHLRAQTDLDDKIQKIELEGIGQACNVYLEKLGG
jgi:hypothetical protein